jgi:hypothetical protein
VTSCGNTDMFLDWLPLGCGGACVGFMDEGGGSARTARMHETCARAPLLTYALRLVSEHVTTKSSKCNIIYDINTACAGRHWGRFWCG